MPMDRRDYPDDWEEISHRVRFERAGGRCEWPGCGARHGSTIARLGDGEPVRGGDGFPLEMEIGDDTSGQLYYDHADLRFVKVVLTTAHTCDCSPICGVDAHCLALCQRCHNRLDAPMRRAHAAETRRRKSGQGFFNWEPAPC